jgi:hypothetical protein
VRRPRQFLQLQARQDRQPTAGATKVPAAQAIPVPRERLPRSRPWQVGAKIPLRILRRVKRRGSSLGTQGPSNLAGRRYAFSCAPTAKIIATRDVSTASPRRRLNSSVVRAGFKDRILPMNNAWVQLLQAALPRRNQVSTEAQNAASGK